MLFILVQSPVCELKLRVNLYKLTISANYREYASLSLPVTYGGTPLNKPSIGLRVFSVKFRVLFYPHVTILWYFSFDFVKATFMKFHKKCHFLPLISQTFELRTIKQRHPYFHPSRTPPHHFRPRTNCRGLLSKPNQEPPFCDMLSIDQLPIS